MPSKGKPIKVDTSPTKHAIVDSLTRDVSIETCIFDLLDNAIDAAREAIWQVADEEDRHHLIDSYAGYEIKLNFSVSGFKIVDNCGGMSTEDLQKLVLRFGERSSHAFGIGIFGVGLNRALFKLGKVSHLKTDNGSERVELLLDTTEYISSSNWELPAYAFESTGGIGTEIEIRQPTREIGNQYGKKEWVDGIRREAGRRYGRFIQKNLKIIVNGETATSSLAAIRDDGPFDPLNKFLKTERDVSVIINCGEHSDHRFRDEEGANNTDLGETYGWTILCNDRAVIVASKDFKTFWKNWHTEYNGFVGYVNFVGDPQHLPWTTTKTDIDFNNTSYQASRSTMENFALNWRSFVEARKKGKVPDRRMPPAGEHSEPAKGRDDDDVAGANHSDADPPPAPAASPRPKKKPKVSPKGGTMDEALQKLIKEDHNDQTNILPADVNEIHCFDKHLALVHEAKEINLLDQPYCGMVLMRVLFECTAIKFATRHKRMKDLRSFAVARRKLKVKLTPAEEERLDPSMDEILAFFQNHPQALEADNTTQLIQCVQKMGARQKILNGVVHNAFQTVHRIEAFQIRDEILPILRHMIER